VVVLDSFGVDDQKAAEYGELVEVAEENRKGNIDTENLHTFEIGYQSNLIKGGVSI